MTNPIMRPPALGDVPPEPPVAQRRRPRHHHGLFWVAVLAALAAVAGGALITATAYLSESTPETTAVSYFHALGRGDAAGALGLGELPAGPRTYLTSQVLDAALSIAKISDVRVLSTVRHGDTAKVTLEYQLGAQQVSDAVSLVRHGRGWRLTRTAVPVHLHVVAGADRMSVAGARVPTTTVLLFPGALPLALDTANLNLRGPQVVHLDGSGEHEIQAVPSPAGTQRVDAAVLAAVQACLGGRTSRGCPPPVDQTIVPGSVRGRVTGNVEKLTKSVAPGRAGLLRISGTLTVAGTYQQLDFNNQPVRRTRTLELRIDARCYATDPAKIVWGAP
ncbi:MAG TPA: hypothetical protein VGJ59_21260 [Jatrophihabitantaceae bacterium]|jgi:hypothetical protein